MQLTLDHPGQMLTVTAHSEQGFKIQGDWYQQSLIITPQQLFLDQKLDHIDQFSASLADWIINQQPDLVLVGSGSSLIFPDIAFSGTLLAANIGCEIMDTAAACRTYNVLASEGRKVLAALVYSQQ